MGKKKTASTIMVSVSTFAIASFYAAPVIAQVVINCAVGFGLGKNAQCSDKAEFVVAPDGSTSLNSGCVVNTSPAKAGQCTVKTGGVPVTKSVRVDFASTFVNMNNGGNKVRLDSFLMQHKTTIPAATKFTFTPTDISNTITVDIGATANITTNQALGVYTGTITVRANEI